MNTNRRTLMLNRRLMEDSYGESLWLPDDEDIIKTFQMTDLQYINRSGGKFPRS
jgi:hypothetical protein